jgi:hypothetical protein
MSGIASGTERFSFKISNIKQEEPPPVNVFIDDFRKKAEKLGVRLTREESELSVTLEGEHECVWKLIRWLTDKSRVIRVARLLSE